MQIIQSAFDGQVHLLEPRVHGDARGYFFEAFRADKLAELGLHGPWLQDNHSLSQRGVLRGKQRLEPSELAGMVVKNGKDMESFPALGSCGAGCKKV